MKNEAFVRELEALRDSRMADLTSAGRGAVRETGESADPSKLLQVALANEIGVADLAAAAAAATSRTDIKLAFARQAGDEARHFELVAARLAPLGFDAAAFTPPGPNPLFDFLRELSDPVERVAGLLFTLEAIAQGVNERFIQVCALRGDEETVRIYREFIQPDEEAHARLGRTLLLEHAGSAELQDRVRAVVARTFDIAVAQRARAAERLGTRSFPGC